MFSVLKHTECPSCGRRHHFTLVGELTVGREYEYVCPERGKKALLRPASAGESVTYPPQGAVLLTAAATQLASAP